MLTNDAGYPTEMRGNSSMQGSKQDYPSRPSRHTYHLTDDATLEADDIEQEPAEIQLSSHGLFYALIIGVLAGLLAAFIPVAITLMNAPLYYEASRLGDKMSYDLAITITGLGCLGSLIDLLLSLVVGYIVGRIAVLRWRGFLAGALVGAITSLGGFIVHYLPNYPDKIVPTTPPPSGAILPGILTMIVILLVYSLIGALMALWGARMATGKHPYYQAQE